MKTIYITFLTAFVISAELGCSRMSAGASPNTTNCDICNTMLHYLPDGAGGCMPYFSELCELIDEHGGCLSCRTGAPMGARCHRPSIDNCAAYNDNGDCLYCNSQHFLQQGSCQPLTRAEPSGKCVVYVANGFCQRCSPGFIARNGSCILALQNCLVQTSFKCDKCVASSFPALTTTANTAFDAGFWRRKVESLKMNFSPTTQSNSIACVFNEDPNCEVSASASTCSVCAPAFGPNSNGRCVPIEPLRVIEGCVLYASPETCLRCTDNFYPSSSTGVSLCVPNPTVTRISNCLYYSSVSKCLLCAASHYLVDPQTCSPVTNGPPNCDVYDSSANCIYCQSSYYHTSTGQIPCQSMSAQIIQGCGEYDTSGCVQCATSGSPVAFYPPGNSNNICAVSLIISSNCRQYSAASVCIACAKGYLVAWPSAAFGCYRVKDPLCRYFSNDGICAECVETAYFDTTTLECKLLDSQSSIPGCITYTGTSPSSVTCVDCGQGNALAQGACSAPANGDRNCLTFSDASVTDGGSCLRCKAKFYPSGASCQPFRSAPLNCDVLSMQTQCVYCTSDYTLQTGNNNSVCVPYKTVPNCDSYSSYGVCDMCAKNYYMNATGECVRVDASFSILGCSEYDISMRCVACDGVGSKAYYLVDGKCVELTAPLPYCKYNASLYACAVCLPGYKLDSQGNGTCIPAALIAGCAEYDVSGQCIACSQNYYLTNNQCFRQTGVADCITYAAESVCAVCSSTTRLVGGNCLPLPSVFIQDCLTYSEADNCLVCRPTFAVSGDGRACIPNCDLADDIGCVSCRGDFYSNSGVCTPVTIPVDNCAHYINGNTCIKCSSGYFLEAGHCVHIQGADNCEEIIESVTCVVCMPGYQLSLGVCTPIPRHALEGCLTASGDGRYCEVCDVRHYQAVPRGDCLAWPEGSRADSILVSFLQSTNTTLSVQPSNSTIDFISNF